MRDRHPGRQSLLAAKYNDAIQSPLVAWIASHRFEIAQVLFILWLICMAYWLYHFANTEAAPPAHLSFLSEDSDPEFDAGIQARSALALILWFCTTGILLVFLLLYVVKFAYNIVWGYVQGVFPQQWHYLLTSLSFFLLLWPGFAYMKELKSVYVTIYSHGREVVELALGFNPRLNTKMFKKEAETDNTPATGQDPAQ